MKSNHIGNKPRQMKVRRSIIHQSQTKSTKRRVSAKKQSKKCFFLKRDEKLVMRLTLKKHDVKTYM